MILLSIFFSFALWANSVLRLDKPLSEQLITPQNGIYLFMSEGCSHCKGQVRDFHSCTDSKLEIRLFLEGASEERLRKEVRRHNFGYPVYWTTQELKKRFEVGEKTPIMIIFSNGHPKKHIGRVACPNLSSLLPKLD